MATPMSAQQVTAELQRKRNFGIPPTSAANQKQYNALKPMAATAKPATMGAIPQMSNNSSTSPVTPMAAQTKPLGSMPNMKPAGLNSDITAVRGGNELGQLAMDQLAMERSGLQNAASSQMESIRNSAKYANQLLQDNRVLEDGNFARTNAPASWDGSTGYRGAILDRGRQIDDTMRAADLANALNSVQQELFSFDANAKAKERGIANELLGTERAYGLQSADQQLQNKQANLGAALSVGDQTGRVIRPQEDWEGLVRQANNPDTPLNQSGQAQQYGQEVDQRNFQYTAGRDKVADEQWLKQFDEQVKQNGIGNALNWAQNAISQQNANTSSASAANSRNNANFGRLMDIWQATGFAPAGIDGVAEGTPYSSGSASSATEYKPTKNEIEAEYYTNLDRLNESDLKTFFSKEKANIIADLGKTGYDSLKEAYGIYD